MTVGLLAQIVVEHRIGGDVTHHAAAPELPNFGAIGAIIFAALIALLLLRRVTRRFRRRERESLERAVWAQSGYYPTTRIIRKWSYGHKKGRRR